MFGYVLPFQDVLKVCELREYKAYYCGLCRCLKEGYGFTGQLSLNYDMAFLGLLLTSLYEPDIPIQTVRCIAHLAHKHMVKKPVYLKYAADMNILLSYYKCVDDWNDEHKILKALYGRLLWFKAKKVKKKYPDKAKTIKESLDKLAAAEKDGCSDIDYISGCFGEICAALFVCHNDLWADDLSKMGYFLGKFIYLLDAYEDMEEDRKKNCYNPFLAPENGNMTQERIYQILLMMMSETGRAFERLPVVQNAGILRNIIYSGVWCRYENVKDKIYNAQKAAQE
ncbi:MAG: hypothetical protein K1W24_08845 [Lachnospiraceae bacterium]